MGTFGYETFDSDAALQIQEIWETYFKKVGDEKFVLRNCVERWGNPLNYGDYATNSQILALFRLYKLNEISVPSDLRDWTEAALNRELLEENLSNWDEPEKRKNILLKYLNSIKGKIKKPKKPLFYRHKSIEYKNNNEAIKELTKLTELNKRFGFSLDLKENSSKNNLNIPEFIKSIDRLMNYHIWQADSNIHMESCAQRRMMLALYLGMTNDYSKEKIVEMMEDCKLENWK